VQLREDEGQGPDPATSSPTAGELMDPADQEQIRDLIVRARLALDEAEDDALPPDVRLVAAIRARGDVELAAFTWRWVDHHGSV
jgi:hypothetical protein